MSNSLWPHGLQATRLLCPWDSPCRNTGVGCHALLQGFFPTQGSNPGLWHCRWILSHLSHQGSPPNKMATVNKKKNKQTKTANVRVNISQDIEKQEPLCTDDGNVMWRIVSRLSKRNLHSIFIAALFTIVKRCKQPKFPSTDGSYLFFHQQTETINR